MIIALLEGLKIGHITAGTRYDEVIIRFSLTKNAENVNPTFTSWIPSTPRPIILTGPGTLRVKSIPTITLIGSYSSFTGRGVRDVGDH